MRPVFRVILLLLMLIGLLTVTPTISQAAQGDVLFTRSLSSDYYSGGAGVLSHGDGTVSTTTCGSASQSRVATFSPSNDLNFQENGSSTQPRICYGNGTVGIDGTLFYTRFISGHPYLVTEKNGVILSSLDFDFQCYSGSRWGAPSGMKIGTDGNLYVVISNGYSCSKLDQLVGINAATGAKMFSQAMSNRTTSSSMASTKLGVYSGGVVALEENVDSNGRDLLSYYSYTGVKNDTLSCTLHSATDSCGYTVVNGEDVNNFFVDENGTAFIDTSRYVGGTCPYARRTLRYTTSGTASVLPRPSDCAAMQLNQVAPSETLVFSEINGSTISVRDTTGNVLYTGYKTDKPGYSVTYANQILLDGTGKVVMPRMAKPNGSNDKFVYVDRLNTDGTWTTLFSTQQFADPNATDNFTFRNASDIPAVAFAEDAMYVTVCSTACNASSQAQTLYRVSSPGMTVEYPRSAIFGEYATDNGQQLNYVALGDSFSSGEGVPPFINGTDVTGVDECHRSPLAYAMLVDQDPSYNVNLTAFRACSGAKLENITTTGQWGESPQLSSLSSNTGLVTITIGGNDAKFKDVAFTCNFDHGVSDCMDQLDDSNTIASSQTFIDDVHDTLEAVQDAAPNAEVIVNGYPYILSSPNTALGQHCGWYAQVASQQEREAMEELVDNLNETLEGAAGLLGMLFVDPRTSFDEHFPCWPDPYLNGADVWNNSYSYHPNEDGQAQYAALLDSWVS